MTAKKSVYDLMQERLKANSGGAWATTKSTIFKQSEVEDAIEILRQKNAAGEPLSAADHMAITILMNEAGLDP